jgi:predicted nucleic acid-binding protein
MSIYVVDPSVAAKWFLPEDHAEAARRILRRGNRLYAPDFFLLETDGVLCKHVRRGDLSIKKAGQARALLRHLPIEFYASESIRDQAFLIAAQTGCSPYDCLYVALAVRLDGRMVTADRRLQARLSSGRFAKYLMWIEDLPM